YLASRLGRTEEARWWVAKYLKASNDLASGKVPHLIRADGTPTTNDKEKAEELLATFFPPLPDYIEEEGSQPKGGSAIDLPDITLEEVERQLFAEKS
ncbi:hypothetical protein IMZ48_28710, partial [Candidatus Bathyarchaeota archaeon]|nr:hypothetical protein [Candidatus Bathyarchaeota archaeon]